MFLFVVFLATCSLATNAFKLNQNFCVNCKHFVKDEKYFIKSGEGKCALFPIIETSINTNINEEDISNKKLEYLVYGETQDIDYTDCIKARQYETMCGPEGKYFKKKENPCFTKRRSWKLGTCLQ